MGACSSASVQQAPSPAAHFPGSGWEATLSLTIEAMDLVVAERAKEEARKAAAEARRKAEEDTRKALEEEEARRAAEAASRQAEEDARRVREEEEAKRAAEAVRKAEEDARKARAEEDSRKSADHATRKAEEDARKAREAEDARRAAEEEEARKVAAEAARKAEEERKAREEEEARKRNLDWTYQAKHPKAAVAEKDFIMQCVEALSKEVVRAGGLTEFLQPGCEVRWNLLTDDCEADDADSPGLMMQRCFKAMLRWWVQTGRDTISVFDRHRIGQGEQKFVRMTLLLNGKQHPITVVWNMEVHLE